MAVRDEPPRRTQGIAGGIAGATAGLWPPRGAAQAGGFAPFGAGIALYFTVDREPVLSVAAALAIGLCAAAFLLRRNRFFPVLVVIAAVAAGFATATSKTARVS